MRALPPRTRRGWPPTPRTVYLALLCALALWATYTAYDRFAPSVFADYPICRLDDFEGPPAPASLRQSNYPRPGRVPFDDAFDEYLVRHTRALNRPGRHKYVEVHLEKSGIGNRLSLLVSGIVLAMLTGRVALMVDKTDFLSQLVTPVEFAMPAMFMQTRTPYDYRAVTHAFHDMLAALALDDLEVVYGDNHWAIGSWDYFVPFLQANEHYRETLRRWFPDGQIAHHVLRRAVRMKGDIENKARDFATKILPGFTVGLHMRRHKFDAAPIRSFANAALNIGAFSSGDPANVTYFLAADDDDVRGEMGRLLGDVRYNSDVDWNDVGANGDPGGSDATALLDLRLLSLSDELVVTFGSSFGQWAASWGGLRYTTVMPAKNSDRLNDREVDFWGSSTSEPCSYNVRNVVSKAGEANAGAAAERYAEAADALLAAPATSHHLQCHPYSW